jgi:hypothetical protein
MDHAAGYIYDGIDHGVVRAALLGLNVIDDFAHTHVGIEAEAHWDIGALSSSATNVQHVSPLWGSRALADLTQGFRVCVATAKSRYPHPFSTHRFVGATQLARFSKKYKLWKSRLRHRLFRPGLNSAAPSGLGRGDA